MFRYLDIHYPETNFVSREAVDPIISGLLGLFAREGDQHWYLLLELLILCGGCCYLFAQLKQGWWEAFLGALATVAVIVFVLGSDPFAIKWHWYPVFTAAFIQCRKEISLLRLVILFFAGFLWTVTAGSLAFFGTLVLLIFVFSRSEEEESGVRKGFKSKSALQCLGLLFLTFSLLVLPRYPIPQFPSGATLAPDSILSHEKPPFFGPKLAPNPVLYSELLTLLTSHCSRMIMVSIGVLVSLFIAFRILNRKPQLSAMILTVVFPPILLGCELWVDHSTADLSPFRIVQRVIPGLGLIEFPWLLSPPFYIIGSILALEQGRRIYASLLLSFLTISTLVSVPRYAPYPTYVDHFREKADNDRLFAVSSFVIKIFGNWVTDPKERERRQDDMLQEIENGIDFDVSATAHPAALAELALDGKHDTRWKTSRPQRPGDFFELKFKEPTTVFRAILSVRHARTDFPRGIRVSATDSQDRERILLDFPIWYGPLQWTADGYPYFGRKSSVILDFPEVQKVQTLRFTQIGEDKKYDWSIFELRLFSAKEDSSIRSNS